MWAAGMTAQEMAEFSLSWRPQDYLDVGWTRIPRVALSALRGFTGVAKGDALERLFDRRLWHMCAGETDIPFHTIVYNLDRGRIEYFGSADTPELMLGELVRIAVALPLLVEAVRASQGRALILFTSYGLLNAVYSEIKAPLESEGILVLAHGTDGSPRQLLSSLRENTRTVILGTSSFWEGVDVQGEALSLLTIVRLPFAVPTDPIYQARSALYDEPFDQYALPQAVLRFRQGFGRLIRSKTDRGVLIVLDRRLRGKRYGDVFMRSLPRCTVQTLASREVAGAVEAWLLPQHV